MAEEKPEVQDSLTPEGEQDTTPDGEETEKDLEETSQDDGKDWQQIAENQRIRAEKAEAKLKKQPKEEKISPKVVSEEQTSELSQSDLIYLAKADIHEDDVEELLNIAKSQGKSIRDTHNLAWVRSFLSERQEERKTAEATSTTSKRGGTKAPSGGEMYSRFEKTGELPESDADIAKLAESRLQSRKNS